MRPERTSHGIAMFGAPRPRSVIVSRATSRRSCNIPSPIKKVPSNKASKWPPPSLLSNSRNFLLLVDGPILIERVDQIFDIHPVERFGQKSGGSGDVCFVDRF